MDETDVTDISLMDRGMSSWVIMADNITAISFPRTECLVVRCDNQTEKCVVQLQMVYTHGTKHYLGIAM